jgi:hypothetical protein
MPNLHVRPLDFTGPGSHKERLRWLKLVTDADAAIRAGDPGAMYQTFSALQEGLAGHLYSDDGRPVAELLAEVSAVEFDLLLASLLRITMSKPESIGERVKRKWR